MSGRLLLSATVCLVALLASSCSEGEEASQPAAPADFLDEVEALCAPVAEEYAEVEGAANLEEFREMADDLEKAERDLVEGLRDLDPPPELEEDLGAYTDALEESSAARRPDEGLSERQGLESIVAASEAEIRMKEASRAAGLPGECPPSPTVDLDNSLFVARANLECHDLIGEVGGDPFDPPRTAKEVALMIDISRRLTARIAGAVKDSATPGTDKELVKKVVKWNKKRFDAIDALVDTFRGGDYRVYREAGRKLMKVSRKVDRKMLSLGLVYCAKAFGVVPL